MQFSLQGIPISLVKAFTAAPGNAAVSSSKCSLEEQLKAVSVQLIKGKESMVIYGFYIELRFIYGHYWAMICNGSIRFSDIIHSHKNCSLSINLVASDFQYDIWLAIIGFFSFYKYAIRCGYLFSSLSWCLRRKV